MHQSGLQQTSDQGDKWPIQLCFPSAFLKLAHSHCLDASLNILLTVFVCAPSTPTLINRTVTMTFIPLRRDHYVLDMRQHSPALEFRQFDKLEVLLAHLMTWHGHKKKWTNESAVICLVSSCSISSFSTSRCSSPTWSVGEEWSGGIDKYWIAAAVLPAWFQPYMISLYHRKAKSDH